MVGEMETLLIHFDQGRNQEGPHGTRVLPNCRAKLIFLAGQDLKSFALATPISTAGVILLATVSQKSHSIFRARHRRKVTN